MAEVFYKNGEYWWKCPNCERSFGTVNGAAIHNGMMHTSVLAKEKEASNR